METMERDHPGKAALEKVMEQAFTHDTNHLIGFQAIVYLHERLERLERVVAERNRVFRPPEPEEVTRYAASIKFDLDGNQFCDYYAARNWCVGKVKMKDWQAAVRTWRQRRAPEQKKAGRLPDNLSNLHDIP